MICSARRLEAARGLGCVARICGHSRDLRRDERVRQISGTFERDPDVDEARCSACKTLRTKVVGRNQGVGSIGLSPLREN